MHRLKKLMDINELKDLWKKIKWIASQSKPIIPFLIFSITLSSILSLIGVFNAFVSKSLIDSAIGGQTSTVIKWLIVMAAIMFGRMAINPFTSLLSTHTSIRFNQQMQKRLYKHISYSEWMQQSNHHSISLLTRITSDVGTISSVIMGTIPSIISLTVTLIASFSYLSYLAPSVAMVAVVLGPVLLVISRLFAKHLKKLYKQIQETDVKYRSFIQETLNNMLIVKTFCLEENNLSKVDGIQKEKYNLSMKNTKISILSGLSMGLCSSITYFTIFCWGALNISKGLGTYGSMTAMLQLYSNVQGPFSSLAGTFPSLIGAIAAAERLMEIEEMTLEDVALKLENKEFENPTIEFKDIQFSYKEGNPIIQSANLTIAPGETIAFVGPSGEGKTTLIRLLLSLIKEDKGSIVLKENGNITELNRGHRELISYVPQGNTLFTGTIEENLKNGKPDATFEEIKEATKLACAWDFINELDDGFDTMIREKENGVSGGQAQRLTIARAFLRKKPILILDEATSSLDSETEINVLNSIKQLDYKPTCIIITHRPSALSICDRVYRLQNGALLEVNNEAILESATE